MKRWLCILTVLLLTSGCGKTENPIKTTDTETYIPNPSTETEMNIPNPWTETHSLSEAEKIAGFSIVVPTIWEDCESPLFRVMPGMLEVVWDNGEDRITLRKAPHGEESDISGDHNMYKEHIVACGDLISYEAHGNNHLFNLVNWNDKDYVYSLNKNPGTERGLSSEEIGRILMEMLEVRQHPGMIAYGSFSYEEDRLSVKEGDIVITEGFVHTEKSNKYVTELAKEETSRDYPFCQTFYDEGEGMWAVHFFDKPESPNQEIVYLDEDGITHLIIIRK